MRADTRLTQLLCARLCHDLGGVVGTLAGTLDLAQPGDAELQAMARETAVTLRDRLRLYAAAWGGPGEARSSEELGTLLGASPAAGRVRFALDGLCPDGKLPGALVPLALNAALLGAEALPRGGTVALGGDAQGLVVLPQGAQAAWPAGVLEIAADQPLEPLLEAGPRRVLAPLLALLAAEAGWTVSLSLGAGPSAAPLLLAPG